VVGAAVTGRGGEVVRSSVVSVRVLAPGEERRVCRLFGLSAGTHRVSATFWLLDAPDSLELQGRRNRDGTGLGHFDDQGAPVVVKQPEPAYSDVEFIREARTVVSTTFVAHVRVATASAVNVENTHPFCIDGRIMAHNGGFEELDRLDDELGRYRDQVLGETDSERFAALIAERVAGNGGDVGAGIAAAASWIAANLPMFSLNLVLATSTELWALRYPEHHRLYVLRRTTGRGRPDRALRGRSTTMRVESDHLRDRPSVVVASEPMDDDPDWRLLEPGELLHVTPELDVITTLALPDPPRRRSIDPLPYVP
jgi:predicted glutamine amidotransferase